MSPETEKTVTAPVENLAVTIIGTGDGGARTGTVAVTPGLQPNLIVNVVGPLMAILVRFLNAYFTMLVGLVSAGMATNIIPAADFWHLVLKCAQLSIAGAGLGFLKDLVTVFGRLEAKYPLLTGSV